MASSAGHTRPMLPQDLRESLLRSSQAFFASPAWEANGALANASSEARAEALVLHLCGQPVAHLDCQGRTDSPKGNVPYTPVSESVALSGPGERRRVLLTGCFDLMHAGHYNALRQAKAAFPGEDIVLVAGVHGDDAIFHAKGAHTVLNHAERVEIVQSCRWVDEVAGDLPYEVPVRLLDRLGCDMAVHGDDLPRVSDGKGLFDELIAANRLKIVKRTEGTSTTMLIGRLLSMSKEHLMKQTAEEQPTPRLVGNELQRSDSKGSISGAEVSAARAEAQAEAVVQAAKPDSLPLWMILPTMSRMSLFYGNRDVKLANATRIVYAPGEWDLFHIGHVRFLQQARELGDFLLVGLYEDSLVHKKKGRNFPLETLHERALNVLACRHVDDVLLGAPWEVSQDLLTTLNISVVATGANNPYAMFESDPCNLGDPFGIPREAGKIQLIDTRCDLTMDVIAERIRERMQEYTARQNKKEAAEEDYNKHKTFKAEG